MKLTRLLVASAAVALAPFAVEAQSFGTGTLAPWTVCVKSLPASTCADGDFGAAKNAGLAGGWTNVNYWITAQNGPNFGNNNGENAAWEITYRTTLSSLTSGTGNVNASAFYLDNYFSKILFNGVVAAPVWNMTGGFGGTPVAAPGENWTKKFGFDLNGLSFNSGGNTLDIVIQGNGVTDAMAIFGSYEVGQGSTTVVTPEPSTYVLMGAGLLALGVAARRRRSA